MANTLAHHKYDKGLVTIYKELLQLDEKTDTHLKNGQRIETDIFPKKMAQ